MCLILLPCHSRGFWKGELRNSIPGLEAPHSLGSVGGLLGSFLRSLCFSCSFAILGHLLPPFCCFIFVPMWLVLLGLFILAYIIYTTEFYESFPFQILMFDTVMEFYLFIFNMFTSEPFWFYGGSLQERNHKTRQIQRQDQRAYSWRKAVTDFSGCRS